MIDLLVRIIITAILAGLESLGLAAFAEPSPESALVEPGTPGVTGAAPIARDRQETAAVLSLLRAVDPCGLHDIAAATRATGQRADQIAPTASLAECQLRLHRSPGQPTWALTTRVGIAYGAAQRRAAQMEEVDGRRVYRNEATDPHARSCTYTRPMGTSYGISLTAEAPIDDPIVRPCPVARAYLTAARPLTHLVLRLEKRTEPRFTLAALDPCAATRAILRTLGVSGAAYPEAPYRCRIQLDLPTGGPHSNTLVTISFGLGPDPSELVGAGTGHQPVTIADHTGLAAMFSPEPSHCEVTLAHDTDVAIHLHPTRFVQTIDIHAASCDQAQTVAAVVLDTIATR